LWDCQFSNQEKSVLWERWRRGDGLREIARLLERGPSSVSKVLSRAGGIQPAPRLRSSRVLSLFEREIISSGLASGKSLRAIAQEIQRAPATVSREVVRNCGSANYRAIRAAKRKAQKNVRL
jgi:IS30 family transposase